MVRRAAPERELHVQDDRGSPSTATVPAEDNYKRRREVEMLIDAGTPTLLHQVGRITLPPQMHQTPKCSDEELVIPECVVRAFRERPRTLVVRARDNVKMKLFRPDGTPIRVRRVKLKRRGPSLNLGTAHFKQKYFYFEFTH